MIRIERPLKTPDILQDSGIRENESNCELYNRHPDEYHSHSRTFKFKHHIYGHSSVKKTLLEAQHGKCCYCESKFLANHAGEVEHFRPKGEVQQERGGEREYPGYYWLAYVWDNLFVSCPSCNSKQNKGSLFPLSDPEARAQSHRDELAAERPLLIDPASEDPQQHIRFRGSASEPLTEKGRETIRVLGLNRGDLGEERRRELAILDTFREVVRHEERFDRKEVAQARNHLEGAVLPDARYSSMARFFLEPDNRQGNPR